MKRNIFIVIRKLDLGGAERHLATYLKYIDKNIFSITILVIYKGGTIENKFHQLDLKLIGPHFNTPLIAKIEAFTKLTFLMLTHRTSVFHLWLPEAYLIGGIVGFITNHQFIIMSRRSLNFYQKKYNFLTRMEHFLHKRTRLFLCNSKKIKEQLIAEGADNKKIEIIYNGIEHKLSQPQSLAVDQREVLKIDRDIFIITCVANLIPYKGHIDLLKAIFLVKNKLNIKFKLICIGRDDGIRHNLEDIILTFDLRDDVIFTGEIKNVYDFLKISDLNILPSHEEGMPNAILESMLMGIPTVATNVGGVAEIIEHNITGILVKPRDPENLSDEIIRLIENNILRTDIGKKGKIHISRNFSIEKCVGLYEKVYSSI